MASDSGSATVGVPLAQHRDRLQPIMSDEHYAKARDVFLEAHNFFARHFSYKDDTYLGPISSIPINGLAPDERPRAAAMQLDGEDPLPPGSFRGQLMSPDYPAPNDAMGPKREEHENHIHANLGSGSSGIGFEL